MKVARFGHGGQVDPRQIAQELTDAHELLNRASMARLAYNGLDGRPRLIPIGIFWTGDEIVMTTAATAPKVATSCI